MPFDQFSRREVIALLGAAAAAWPIRVRAETMRRVGILFGTSADLAKARGLLAAIIRGLQESGWVEGQSFAF
jgi:hypothetical protein